MSTKRMSIARPRVLAAVLLGALAAQALALSGLDQAHRAQVMAEQHAAQTQAQIARQARELERLRSNASLETETAP
jgi:hypothetical protein